MSDSAKKEALICGLILVFIIGSICGAVVRQMYIEKQLVKTDEIEWTVTENGDTYLQFKNSEKRVFTD